jgi:hypothetical protein
VARRRRQGDGDDRRCGADWCGRISRILERQPGWKGNDVNNPDPALKSRPVIGLPILTGF